MSPRALAKASVKASTKPVNKPASAPKPAAKAKPPESKWLKIIRHSLEEMKAEDTVVIDLSDKSSIGDTMVVTTGRSNVHLASIADRVVKDLKAAGMTGIAVEGLRQGDWVVIDTGSVLVHVFRPEVRAFYAIEKMWSA
ncbi:MAG: ribosome silencing factor [Pseudolabrys sp.]|nr:ribosome silencing factor [Pseudolabrys sp.]